MASLVALITLITLIGFLVRHRSRGESWLLAALTGVKHSLLGVIALHSVLVVLAVGVGTGRAILHPVTETMIALFPDSQPPASRAGQRLEAPQIEVPTTVTPPLPTPTPRAVAAQEPQPQVQPPTSLSYEAAMAPLRTPVPAPEHEPASTPTAELATLPTVTPTDSRPDCDPAYPDERTCIPPGPPWDQGCAITDERRFRVLSPDPQGMDHDGDGIGCVPIT